MLWVLLWPYHPLPCLHCTCSLLSYWVTCRYLTFLAVDWLRTVSASRPLCFALFVLSLPADCAPFPLLSLPLCLWVLCWAVRPLPSPFLPGLSPPWCCLCLFVCLAGFLVCFVLLAVPAYPGPPLLFGLLVCLYPWVRCLVFLAVDWSRISSIVPPLPILFWLGSFHPDRLSLCVTSPAKTPVWYFWP